VASALVTEANRACLDACTECVQACEACAQRCIGDRRWPDALGSAWTAPPSARLAPSCWRAAPPRPVVSASRARRSASTAPPNANATTWPNAANAPAPAASAPSIAAPWPPPDPNRPGCTASSQRRGAVGRSWCRLCPRAEPGEAAGYAHKRGIGDARAAAGPCQCRCLASAAAHRPSLFSARSPAWSARVRFRRCHRYAGGLCPHPPGGQRTRWPCWQTAAARCRRSGGGVSVGQRLRRGAGWPDWRS